MTTSGTYTFGLSNSDLVLEAFDRIQIRPAALTPEHLQSARVSLNLELLQWGNRGVMLWAVQTASLTLVAGQATYTLPTTCNELLDTYYSIPATTGTTDRMMMPMSRDIFAALPAKSTPGLPTQYWFQRLVVPQVTFWPVPAIGSPNETINFYYLRRLQDAAVSAGQTPDIVDRYFEALVSGLCARLAEKYAPTQEDAKVKKAMAAWIEAAQEDRDSPAISIMPNLSSYWRI